MSATKGRPRKYKNESERFREIRLRAKMEGKKDISLWLSGKHKGMLDTLCHGLKVTQAEAFSYLLECAFDRELPDLTHTPNTSDGEGE